MYAIIKTGGKQYRVENGDELHVEKLDAKVGDTVTFDEVVAVGGDKLSIGKPLVPGMAVTAKVLEQGKEDKVIIYKYKAKKDYRRKNGHRQPFTLVKITSIGDNKDTKSESKPAAAKPAAKTEPKPATKTTAVKAEPKAESKPAASNTASKTSTAKPAAKAESKPAAKAEPKTAAKTESKPAASKPAKFDSSMKKDELLAIASKAGLDVSAKNTKQEILDALASK